jgi:2-polyprenyl-3-methyl-5-hydroxy-6-metoxy-1,4-benzoquinol methylase
MIFAGHVIEHLDSPFQLFQFAEKLLNDSGRLVIVTPNPLWFISSYYRNIGKTFSVNIDHVAIFVKKS